MSSCCHINKLYLKAEKDWDDNTLDGSHYWCTDCGSWHSMSANGCYAGTLLIDAPPKLHPYQKIQELFGALFEEEDG